MGFDSISSVPLPVLNNKDFAKKKRTNRLAKLKQSKLDVRREQWLSQVKNKGCKMDSIGKRESPPSSNETVDEQNPSDGLESRSRVEETESSSIHDGDMESLMSSPIGSSLDHSDSTKGHSSSSTSSGYSSGSVSDCEEEDDEDCLDNWETIADALIAKEKNVPNPVPDSNTVSDIPKTDGAEAVAVAGSDVNSRAWRSDDASRPQSLPNLSKQHGFVTNSHQQCSHGPINRAWQSVMSHPSSCPICCEDLDVTDTSFLPCSCGFRLCLFCHKRILEADGRCPGCRKHYDLSSENSSVCGTCVALAGFCISWTFLYRSNYLGIIVPDSTLPPPNLSNFKESIMKTSELSRSIGVTPRNSEEAIIHSPQLLRADNAASFSITK